MCVPSIASLVAFVKFLILVDEINFAEAVAKACVSLRTVVVQTRNQRRRQSDAWLVKSRVDLTYCNNSCSISRGGCESRNVDRLSVGDHVADKSRLDPLDLSGLHRGCS